MEFITSKDRFDQLCLLSKRYLAREKKLPGNVFLDAYSVYQFATFDEIRMRLFFRNVCSFLKRIGEERFAYLVLDPPPEEYGVKVIDKYKALELSVHDGEDEFIAALNTPSGGEAPDCIMDNADEIFVMSGQEGWCAYADRETDVAIFAFSDANLASRFEEVYGADLLPGLLAASHAYRDNEDLRDQFCCAYHVFT